MAAGVHAVYYVFGDSVQKDEAGAGSLDVVDGQFADGYCCLGGM